MSLPRLSLRGFLSLVVLVPVISPGCVVSREPEGGSRPGTSASSRMSPREIESSVLASLDQSIDPCQDFYQYACGTWIKNSKIPADRTRWGRGFAEIEERNLAILRQILDGAAKDTRAEGERGKIGRFFASCMDEQGVEQAGIEALKPLLATIATVKDPRTLMEAAGYLQESTIPALFQPAVFADFKNPDIYIAYYLQGGIGLPDRDYYLKDDEASRAIRSQYQAHVARMLALLGEPEEAARRSAASVVAFETKLAQASLPREQARDLERLYNKIDLAGLQKLSPGLPWDAFLAATGYPDLVSINVGMPDFFKGLSAAAVKASPDTLQAYLRWQLVHASADALPRAFVEEDFAFFGKTLNGQKEIRPREKRCAEATDEAMGEALGRLYVEQAFAGESKAIALEMIVGIESALEAALPGLGWMDDATRERAKGKLKQVSNKIGYPDVWRDYGELQVGGDYLGNALAAARFEFHRQHDKVGGPVDRKEWGMTPPTVNAYYNPTVNEMVFPAGIMQPPFFSRDFPRAMNYGGVGMAMGHELTHGFDDQGRKFDGSGKMQEWWDPAVSGRFEERAQCVETLYSGFEVEPGLKVNGKLTLGENIADLGGLKEAFRAYKAWEEKSGAPRSIVAGQTNDQLFFLGFAQSWCELITPERARVLVTVDPHSPARFRVNGSVQSFPAFAQAYACAEGVPMNPASRCEVW